MNALGKVKAIIAVLMVAVSIGAQAESIESILFLDSAPEKQPVSVGILKKIIEVQGHTQLRLGPWNPGVNDLTEAQMSKLNFDNINFDEFWPLSADANDHDISDTNI